MTTKRTLKDVALEAGVAINTVSSILNNRSDSWASEETKVRVRAAAAKLGYQPNQAARGLRLRRYNTIGGLFSDLTNLFCALPARFLRETFGRRGFTPIFRRENEKSYFCSATFTRTAPSANSATRGCPPETPARRKTGAPASSRMITKPRFNTDAGLAACRRFHRPSNCCDATRTRVSGERAANTECAAASRCRFTDTAR